MSKGNVFKGIFGDKNKTFRPKKQLSKGTKRYELHKHAKATLGSGDLRSAVALPEGGIRKPSLSLPFSGPRASLLKPCFFWGGGGYWPIRGHRRVDGREHCGLFQPGQLALRKHHRVLHSEVLSGHVSRSQAWSLPSLSIIPSSQRERERERDSFLISFCCLQQRYEYLWADVKNKRPVKLSAPQYVDNLMAWVQVQFNSRRKKKRM